MWELELSPHGVWRLWSVIYCAGVHDARIDDMEGAFATAAEALEWMLEHEADACKCNGPPAVA